MERNNFINNNSNSSKNSRSINNRKNSSSKNKIIRVPGKTKKKKKSLAHLFFISLISLFLFVVPSSPWCGEGRPPCNWCP